MDGLPQQMRKFRSMKDRRLRALATVVIAAFLSVPWGVRADIPDALDRANLADPITADRSGTVQVIVTATIRNSLNVEYVSPMVLEKVDTGNGRASLRLISGEKNVNKTIAARPSPRMTAAVEIQGIPNQTFAISIDQATQFRPELYVATFSHNAGQTPHVGPAGDTEFSIGVALKLAKSAANYNYSGALDVIVSHN
jgi:hypothetical protein